MRWGLGFSTIIGVMIVFFLSGTGLVFAAKPVVYLQPLCTYNSSINNLPLDEADQSQLDRLIRDKLHQMSVNDDLPFELREIRALDQHSTNEHILDEGQICLYPTVMVSTSVDTANNNSLETAYTSTVIAGISLLFCMPEENLDIAKVTPEGNTVTLRLLGIVPLVGAGTIGLSEYNLRTEQWQNIHNTPISEAEKKGKLLSLVCQSLKDDISFSSLKSNLRDDKAKLGLDTYQVTAVDISSAKAQEMYVGREAEDLQFLIGYFFTSAYHKKTKRVVYPPAVGGQELAGSMVDGAYKLSLDSANGRVDVAMSHPQHPIRLDVTGLAGEVVDSGYNVYTMLHKVWLAKSPVEGKEKRELSRLNERTVKLPPGTSTDYDDKQVYTALLLGLAQELGGQNK